MRKRIRTLFAAGLIVVLGVTAANADERELVMLAGRAVSSDRATAEQATRQLRQAGPDGLAMLLHVHRGALDAGAAPEPQYIDRLNVAIDAVGAQLDCRVSKLYWYTDLAEAQRAAQDSGKPILSLRLLGNLTDELSCANSRFFRSTLYANEQVSRMLRERFVLHWQSERPAPKVTIDFGDGRQLVRTVTGNSIHYILDADGKPIDALPGLYGPAAFTRGLQDALSLHQALAETKSNLRRGALQSYHAQRAGALEADWRADLARLGVRDNGATPTMKIDEALWAQIASLHLADAELDAASRALIRSQNPTAGVAAGLAIGKAKVEDPLVAMLRSLQNAIAIDSVRNEYVLHRQIHQWMAQPAAVTLDLPWLNERVYSKLFLTPSSDPWLGLLPGNTYSGLTDAGIVAAQPAGH